MRRTALERKTPLKSAGFGRAERKEASAVSKLRKVMSSRGMKGRPPTAQEKRFMDRMGTLPCIACLKDGWTNHVISLHHIDGRTKPGAHFLVLPLCAPHHQQDDTDLRQRISLHGRKATFQARYGAERELLAECIAMLPEAIEITREAAPAVAHNQ